VSDSSQSKTAGPATRLDVVLANIGWAGAALIVLAYLFVSNGKISGQSFDYQFMNLFGAGLVAVSSWVTKNWPSVALQVVWMAISLLSLLNIF
jgi:hypothetical protein